ncbi:MAG TPA: GWxTD domain-containing protein [Thermoanaerobaculia bacterium]|jgi:GWxTD domain-containing protein|nr:GWxTD domain-containing protein [Thermoanaerobaculia bacterium]
MTAHRKVLLLIALSLTSLPAFAALSPELKEWGAGPVQWIMTSDEKKAWRKIATDGDAVNFIDLFWVRRDPTEGTAINEYRNEFDARVASSDARFVEKRRSGAMTDRGRVHIVLGDPTELGVTLSQTNAQMGIGGADSGARERGNRDVWSWEHADAQKFDMPKIEIVFVESQTAGGWFRDPLRADFGVAEKVALRKAITQPSLTSVPAWAPSGGLRPIAPITLALGPQAAQSLPPPPTEGSTPEIRAEEPAFAPGVVSSTPGVSRLTLLPRGSINARASADPFAAAQSVDTFKGNDGVWAVQYCPAEEKLPPVKYLLFMTGPLDGVSREQTTKEKDAKPERLSSQPGCYVIHGTIPSSKLTPGRYKLTVLIDDSGGNGSHKVKGEFHVE